MEWVNGLDWRYMWSTSRELQTVMVFWYLRRRYSLPPRGTAPLWRRCYRLRSTTSSLLSILTRRRWECACFINFKLCEASRVYINSWVAFHTELIQSIGSHWHAVLASTLCCDHMNGLFLLGTRYSVFIAPWWVAPNGKNYEMIFIPNLKIFDKHKYMIHYHVITITSYPQ